MKPHAFTWHFSYVQLEPGYIHKSSYLFEYTKPPGGPFNSSPPGAAYMRQFSEPTLVQVMATINWEYGHTTYPYPNLSAALANFCK